MERRALVKAVLEEGRVEPRDAGRLVAWGAGIRPGARLPVIDSVDVAPTIARLLGLRMENVDGTVREDMIK